MGACGDKQQRVGCGETVKALNIIGSVDNASWKHTTKQSIKLGSTVIFSTDRKASCEWVNDYLVDDAFVCIKENVSWPGAPSDAYFVVESYDHADYFCKMVEENTIVDNKIIFLDLRHDILVRKETTHTYNYDKTSGDSTLWNSGVSTFRVHKLKAEDLDITETTKIYINDTLLESFTIKNYSDNPYTLTFPPATGLPQSNTTTDGKDDEYYIWSQQQLEDGGYDLYYPSWVRDISKIATPIDVSNRDRHRGLVGVVPYDREPINTSLSSFYNLIYVETSLDGSWAVSPQQSADINYRAYCTKLIDGVSFKLQTVPESIETTTLFGSPSECVFPISPL